MKKQISTIHSVLFIGLGFTLAWLIKPVPTETKSTVIEENHKSERAGRPRQSSTRQSYSRKVGFFELWRDIGYDQRVEALASLRPEEIPGLLQDLRMTASIFKMSYEDQDMFEALFVTWHDKDSDAALTWLRALPEKNDRMTLLGILVNRLMETDPDAALSLLTKEGTNEYGLVDISDSVMNNAAATGAEMLVEIFRLSLGKVSSYHGYQLNYPEDFDFKLALDGLVTARQAKGDGMDYGDIPLNLMSEWARNDSKAAWDWLQNNKPLHYNGMKEFFASYASTTAGTSEEIGVMLASTSAGKPLSGGDYENVWAALEARPTPQLLDAFLEAVPGDRAIHLDSLFDKVWFVNSHDGNDLQVGGLLLERMSSAQRLEALRRNNPYLYDKESGLAFGWVLRRLGHNEDDIQRVLPSLR